MHPLGKSPVITDGDITIAESGAIVDYIIRRYGKGAMMPAPGSADYEAYNEWLHYSEGSAMLPLMLQPLCLAGLKEAGAPLHPRIDSEIANHLGYVDGALKGREFFVGHVADRRRYPDELCRRDGKSVRQARTVSEPRRRGCRACMRGRRSSARSRRAGRTGLRSKPSFRRTPEPIRA